MASAFLPARYHPLLNTLIYRVLVRPALTGGFQRVNARLRAPQLDPLIPVLWYGNHSSWWDGYVPFALNHLLWKREGYVMIEDKQLSRYQFFRWAGGFSINRSDARSALTSLNYAARMLAEGRNRALLIYPQGEIAGNDIRPLRFFTGLGHVVKTALRECTSLALVPLALRYEFIGEQKPEAFASFGAPLIVNRSSKALDGRNRISPRNAGGYAISPDQPFLTNDMDEAALNPKALTAELERALTAELDQLRDDVAHYRFDSFQTLISGGQSINRIFDRVLGRGQISDVGR